ncbi:MAG TPA: hypothetical protein VGM25_02375 [Caulobacteraceae bacterium]
MACILSLSTSRYAVQVSDRRPVRAAAGGQGTDPGDSASDAVIFIGSDGAVSIGYTGAAHVGGQPGGQAATDGVADAVYRIRRALAAAPEPAGELEILVCGFRCKADRWLPVNLRVRHTPGKSARALGRVRLGARHPGSRQVVAAAVGCPPTLSEFAVALGRLASRASRFMTADEGAAMLAGLVRTVAARDHGVGADLMTTIIQPPGAGPLMCRFSPLHYGTGIALRKTNAVSLRTPRLLPLGTAECSPWIIGRQAVLGPAAFHGGSGPTLQADGYVVTVESGRPEPMTAQWRRPRHAATAV